MRTEIRTVRLADLTLLAKNARYMAHETYWRLVENVRRDGGLTSVPLVYEHHENRAEDDLGGGVLEVLSGNHRVQTAIDAGIEQAEVMVILDPLTRQQRVALQLSHNAITGEDDPTILRELYEELENVDWRAYSGLDDKTLELLGTVEIGNLGTPQLELLTVTLAFLPDENEDIERVWRELGDLAKGAKATWLGRRAQYDQALDALAETGSAHRVSNVSTQMLLLMRLWLHHRELLAEGWLDQEGEPRHDGWVPLASVLGTDRMPARAAAVVQRAVERMVSDGAVGQKNRWQSIELLAADYLGGSDGE